MLERKEAEKQRALIAEAAQKEAERKQKCAEKERLEAATTLVEFSQQVFIKEQSTQTETASPSKPVANCSTQTDGDVTTVVKESEQLKRKLQSSIFRATIILGRAVYRIFAKGGRTWSMSKRGGARLFVAAGQPQRGGCRRGMCPLPHNFFYLSEIHLHVHEL